MFRNQNFEPVPASHLTDTLSESDMAQKRKTRAGTPNFIPAQKCPNTLYKCVGGPTSQGCLFIRKCTRFDVDTTIVYSVLSFEFWALVSGLEERKREQGEILKPLSNVTVEGL